MASQPVAVVSFAAPEYGQLLTQWEKHLLPLQQAGRITAWSEQHLLPGSERDEQIARHLEQADIIVLLLSTDFFADEECRKLMALALQWSKSRQVRIIPLLLRPVGWRTTPVGHLTCLPNNGRPVTRWGNRDEAFQDCVNSIPTLFDPPAASQQTSAPHQSSFPAQPSQASDTQQKASLFLPDLEEIDNLVMKLLCEEALANDHYWISIEKPLIEAEALEIHQEQFIESVRVLKQQKLLEIPETFDGDITLLKLEHMVLRNMHKDIFKITRS